MDAAQMLTAREIARQCEQLARLQQRHPSRPAPGRRWWLAEAVATPVEQVAESDPEPAEPEPEPPAPGGELTERDRSILAFERQWWKHPGAKERAIREIFGLSASGYNRLLDALVASPAALRVDPMLIRRLRRERASR